MTNALFDVFRSAMLAKPNGSRREAQDEFVAKMMADPVFTKMLARDYFDRMASYWKVQQTELGHTLQRSSAPTAEAIARTDRAYNKLKAKIRNVILLDLELPNGKKLRHATGAECKRAGGFYADVAKHILPSQVVDKHLTEADLQNIRTRHFYTATASTNTENETLASAGGRLGKTLAEISKAAF